MFVFSTVVELEVVFNACARYAPLCIIACTIIIIAFGTVPRYSGAKAKMDMNVYI